MAHRNGVYKHVDLMLKRFLVE